MRIASCALMVLCIFPIAACCFTETGLGQGGRVPASQDVAPRKADGSRSPWSRNPLRKIPLAYRHDGFSMYYAAPPGMTRHSLLAEYVEPFRSSNVEILVWGLGPGSVFCYDTKVGQVFGAPLSREQWKLMRAGDRRVYENVSGMIRAGDDPLRVAVAGAHAIGRKLFARLEMNHEYGPADEKNWLWIAFVGALNKQDPQFRIPGHVRLDFAHREVRDFKLAIFREALQCGADGIELDFAVYPPFFAKPQCAIMTQFMRDVRKLADEAGCSQQRRIELMARVPFHDAEQFGLDWKTWMRDGLVDIIVPTHRRPSEAFDIDIDEFITLRTQTACKVYPTLWQALGFVNTDARPGDEKKGVRRYDKPKTKEMFFAQAMLFHRAGADGLQLGFAANEWNTLPWLNDLSDPTKIEFADKHYMVDPKPNCPVRLTEPVAKGAAPHPVNEKTVSLRIGDAPAEAIRRGYCVEAELLLYARPLKAGESISAYVNGQRPAVFSASANSSTNAPTTVDASQRDQTFSFDRDWWRHGELRVPVPGAWWHLGRNTIRLVYNNQHANTAEELSIRWIDLLLHYKRPPNLHQ
jgi:hypothetical protein